MRSTVLLILGVLVSIATLASNLSFLQGSAISRFTSEDIDLMMKNADEALAAESSNAKREWKNPKTGASGFAEVRGQFVSTEGRTCKRLKVGNRAIGAAARNATYTLCIHEDSGWMVDADAKPAATGNP
jgi:hypothetical protein